MNFQAVKTAIIALLESYAPKGLFTVMAYQQQVHDADAIAEYNRHVSVFYKTGSFNTAGSRPSAGILQHDMTFDVQMLVSAHALVDLATIDNPASTPQQLASALGAQYSAGAHADELLDDLWHQLFIIFENPLNYQLGQTGITIAEVPGKLRLNDFQKSDIAREGQTVLIGASATLNIRCVELTAGETSKQPLVGLESSLAQTADIATGIPDLNVSAAPPGVDVENGS